MTESLLILDELILDEPDVDFGARFGDVLSDGVADVSSIPSLRSKRRAQWASRYPELYDRALADGLDPAAYDERTILTHYAATARTVLVTPRTYSSAYKSLKPFRQEKAQGI